MVKQVPSNMELLILFHELGNCCSNLITYHKIFYAFFFFWEFKKVNLRSCNIIIIFLWKNIDPKKSPWFHFLGLEDKEWKPFTPQNPKLFRDTSGGLDPSRVSIQLGSKLLIPKVQGPILCSCNTRPLNKSFFFFSLNFMILKFFLKISLTFSKISQISKNLNFLCQKISNNLSGKNKNHWYLLAYKGTYWETKSNEPGYFPILQRMRLPG